MAAQDPSTVATQGKSAADFGRYVEDASNNDTGKAAERAPSAALRKLMPGQIAGSRDTLVTPAAAATAMPAANPPATAPAATTPAVTSPKMAMAALSEAGGEGVVTGRETLNLLDSGAGPVEEAAQGDSGTETEGIGDTILPQTISVQADGDEQDDTASEGSEDRQADEEAMPAAETAPVVAMPEQPPVAPVAGAVPSVLDAPSVLDVPNDLGVQNGGPSETMARGDGAGHLSAVTTDSSAALPQTPGGAVPKVVPDAGKAKEVRALPIGEVAAPDSEGQPGMTQFVEAGKAGMAEAKALKPGETGGIEIARAPGGAKASSEAALEAPRGSHHDNFRFGGEVFSQVLEGFAGAHAPGRGGGLPAQPDPALAAQAQNSRVADMQRPTPLQMLPIEIGMQAVRGVREFQIRLDPAELGRVDVKLHISDKGEVNASMIVERPETLQMLRRDATTLAQAFEQAGLKQGENALSFSLRGEGQGQHQQADGGRGGPVEDPALSAQVTEIVSRRVLIPNASLDRVV